MFVTPDATPVTVPSVPTVATVVFADDQVPPVAAVLNAVVDPAQTVVVPEIAEGAALTVTPAVILHPVAAV
jgi:hypothetical protein